MHDFLGTDKVKASPRVCIRVQADVDPMKDRASLAMTDHALAPIVAFSLEGCNAVCVTHGGDKNPPPLDAPLDVLTASDSRPFPTNAALQPGDTIMIVYTNKFIDLSRWTCMIAQWATVDLHRFWGESAFRILAFAQVDAMEGDSVPRIELFDLYLRHKLIS